MNRANNGADVESVVKFERLIQRRQKESGEGIDRVKLVLTSVIIVSHYFAVIPTKPEAAAGR